MLITFNKKDQSITASCPFHHLEPCDGPICAWFQMVEPVPMQPADEIRGKCAVSYLEDIAYQLRKIKEEASYHE